MNARNHLFIACALFAVTACENKEKTAEKPAQETAVTVPVPPPPPPVVPAQVDLSKVDTPTEAEFEAEAEQSISAKNLDQELDKLEKEIAAP